jgi:transposase
MKYFAGLDVSLEEASVCIVDESGTVIREGKAASDPEALAAWLGESKVAIARVGLEAGPLSTWLQRGLSRLGYGTDLMETREVKARLNAQRHKTDRVDARGIAQLLRVNWYRPVHVKSARGQDDRTVLGQRKFVLGQLRALELSVRGTLKGYGLKLGRVSEGDFAARVRELVADQALLVTLCEAMLAARAALLASFTTLDKLMRSRAKSELCQRLMTMPGVGPHTALAFVATIDDPGRFKASRQVGAYLGLTPRTYQSGEIDRKGRITRHGDGLLRTSLFEAAIALLTRVRRPSALQAWGRKLARKRGAKRAIVALARRMAVILHRMWLDGTEFRWSAPRHGAPAPIDARAVAAI